VEFPAASTVKTPAVEAVVAQNRRLYIRQAARARRMSRALQAEQPYSMAGKVRCSLSVLLFLICVFVFMLGDSETYKTPINQLEPEYQFVVSVGICLVSAILLLPSFRRHRVAVSLGVLLMLSMGGTMPLFWHARVPESAPADEEVPVAEVATPHPEPEAPKAGRLSAEDLEVFRALQAEAPRQRHYAIYMTRQNSSTRTMVRESLTRLLQAEYARAYTRAEGALFVVANVRVSGGNVSRIASRYGQVVYANSAAGVYEVDFDAEKANLVSCYSADVLTTPHNPNFVVANVSELMCMEPMRVSAAANMLASANVQVLRRDIRDAILQVLNDPWESEPETLQALLEALVVYAPNGDGVALARLREYFEASRSQGKGVSPKVMRRLIAEDPDAMVEPVVQLWSANPVVWNEMMAALGSRAEEVLLLGISLETDLQLLDAVLKYLADFGTKRAVPTLQMLQKHPDSLVKHKADRILNDILQHRAD